MILVPDSDDPAPPDRFRDGVSKLIDTFEEEWEDRRGWPITAKRLALLSCRLFEELGSISFSAWRWDYLSLILQSGSYKATYFIDIFCQLDWLLRGLLRNSAPGGQGCKQLPHQLASQVTDLLKIIQPIMDTCRCIYAACTFSATARSKYLSNPTPLLYKNVDTPLFNKFVGFRYHHMSFRLQDLLKKGSQFSFYTWPLALVDVLDLMLEIASIMRSREEWNFPHGHLDPQNLILATGKFGHCVQLIYSPTFLRSAGKCYIAPEISVTSKSSKKYISSDVYSYGSVCFNILTADVPGALKFTQTIRSPSKFYEFVRRGSWKQMVHGKPEYLVRLIAWCWETDPSKRPAFSTICSLLQRAMRCLIFPPVLNLTRLSKFLQQREYSLLNLYLSFIWSRDIRPRVIGTKVLYELVQAFYSDTIERQHFRSDFMCSKVMQAFAQIKACRRMASDQSNVKALVLKHVNSTESAPVCWKDADSETLANLCSHPSSTSSHSGGQGSLQLFGASTQELEIKQGFSEAKLEGLPALAQIQYEEEDLDFSSAQEMQLGCLIEVEKEFDSCSDIVFKSDILEQHSILFEVLVYDCMLATFPSLDYRIWIGPLINMSHHNQKLPIPRPTLTPGKLDESRLFPLPINYSLLPRLVCFWEGQTCSHEN